MRKLKMKLPMSSAMYCYLINRYVNAQLSVAIAVLKTENVQRLHWQGAA